MNKNYFELLKKEIKKMVASEEKSTLKKYNNMVSRNDKVKSIKELEDKFDKFMSMLGIESEPTTKDYETMLKEKIIDSYEEEKENITFGALLENSNNNLIVSLLIFDKEFTYSNLLVKVFDKYQLNEAKLYFDELKNIIINNNLNDLSKIILEKMSN